MGALAIIVGAGVLVGSYGIDGAWSDAPTLIAQSAVYLTTGMVVGVAFGMVLLATRASPSPRCTRKS